MSVFDLPSSLAPASFEWAFNKQTVPHRSSTNAQFQAVDLLSDFWSVTLTLPPALRSSSGAIEALFMRLAGGVDRLRLWHAGRPYPTGTARGTLTLSSSISQFANSFTMSGAGAGATLKAGDMFGLTVAGSPCLFMVADDATANGSGVITVTTVNRARASVTSGASISLNKPTANFALMDQSVHGLHKPDCFESLSVQLQEAWT